jgi:hypothetical protein
MRMVQSTAQVRLCPNEGYRRGIAAGNRRELFKLSRMSISQLFGKGIVTGLDADR